jgi:hypothetical protein
MATVRPNELFALAEQSGADPGIFDSATETRGGDGALSIALRDREASMALDLTESTYPPIGSIRDQSFGAFCVSPVFPQHRKRC